MRDEDDTRFLGLHSRRQRTPSIPLQWTGLCHFASPELWQRPLYAMYRGWCELVLLYKVLKPESMNWLIQSERLLIETASLELMLIMMYPKSSRPRRSTWHVLKGRWQWIVQRWRKKLWAPLVQTKTLWALSPYRKTKKNFKTETDWKNFFNTSSIKESTKNWDL